MAGRIERRSDKVGAIGDKGLCYDGHLGSTDF